MGVLYKIEESLATRFTFFVKLPNNELSINDTILLK